ncbi:hypothetical protein AGMMS50239_35640 [Bacteroidia bacterium]|nr:hypothetical protein AGMMS50239_35640 [Bacteroidia bacterium]
MNKEFIYFMLFLLLASSCLNTPDMTVGIANMKEDPTVETKTDVTFSNENFTLTIKGKILAYGKNSAYFRQGFCWGTNSTNLVDSVYFMKTEIDTFSYDLQNLDGNLTYYWRAIAKNQYGIALGEIQKYETPSEEPSVVSGENSDFPADGAIIFKGEILAYGKINDGFKKGFYWGKDEENLTDSVFLENDGFEPDTFSYTLPNARGNTTYYWRAFAKNDYGISLGVIREKQTPPIFISENKDVFRGQIRSNFTVFSLKNTLYVTCGDYNNILISDVWRYDNNGWFTDYFYFPGGARRYPVAFTIDDSLAYVGTGQGLINSQRISFGDFYIFNGNTRTWTETSIQTPAEMPRYEAVAFSLNNKGYVVGGRNETGILNDVWKYSIENNAGSWEKMNDFPRPFYGGISLYDKERVFAGFGNNPETVNTLWEYDAGNDQWTVFAPSPTYPSGIPAKIRSGQITRDKIYLLDITNIIWELDLESKQYKQKSVLPQDFPSQNEQYMFSLEDVIYIGLGGTPLFYRYYPFWDN